MIAGLAACILKYIDEKEKSILILLLSCTVVAGLVYSVHLGSLLRFEDERAYCKLASNLITMHRYTLDGIRPDIYRPPGYPFILACFMALGVGIVGLRIVNLLSFAGCMYLSYLTLKRQTSALAAVIGMLMVICYPVLIFTSITLYPQIPAAFLCLLCLYVWGKENVAVRMLMLTGILFGLLVLMVPTFLFVGFIFAMLYRLYNQSLSFKRLLLILVPALIIVGLWSVRNYKVFHSFVFVSTNSGHMLLYGNSENTTPNNGPNANLDKYYRIAQARHMNDIEQQRYYIASAENWILHNKSKAAKLYVLKVLNNFNYRNDLETRSEASPAREKIMLLTYGPLVLLFFIRIFAIRKYPLDGSDLLFIVIYLVNAFVSAVFFTRIRYRLPFDFLMIIVAAGFAARVISGVSPLRDKSVGLCRSKSSVPQ